MKKQNKKKITITGISGKNGKSSWIGVFVSESEEGLIAEGNANISGSPVTIYLEASKYTNKNNNEYGGWTGTGLVEGKKSTPVLISDNKDGNYVFKDYDFSSSTTTIAFNRFVKE